MTNLSFSDLSVSQRRERIAALLAIGLQRVLDQRARISANSGDSSLEVSSDLRLSVSQPDFGDPHDADDEESRPSIPREPTSRLENQP
jgi:hypothetical protein